ncbi:galactan 5-O-arabinofuranosyltransferase [Mycobacterium sp. MYCO198283]|uniref:arabinofuranosyltransferase n=1 Tax=Mycobacterium sp. MYCO198283 TaxID=2883505 RepID=UPI001E2A207C|nr:arabinofuranosyltransferase [Mycobacterium sp. MYCO198283]MCG5432964.1 galactan 5-O-arabinofuranosyltransferase [Mycobacterium sp. MYCO198283]
MRAVWVTAGRCALAVAVAVVVSVVALAAIARVEWPAFNSSNQLHALTTVGQFGCLAGLVLAGWLWRRGRRAWAHGTALTFLSAFVVATLGMPLGATKLYLFGVSVDQQFRTEFVTRLADSAALRDMTYADLPPFYPAGWFWLGGRAAALTGTPAWETVKPWSICSIAIAVALAFVLWSTLIRFEYALAVTTATAAVTLAYGSPEPYSAMITVLLPAIFVLAWSGLRGHARTGASGATGERHAGASGATGERHGGASGATGERHGGKAAVVGVGVFLGVTATFYTLLLAYAAVTVTVMAAVAAWARRRDGRRAVLSPLLRLAVIAAISAAIAAITWLPYLVAAARAPASGSGSALHYLPADGASLTFPMLQFTLLGALTLLGTLWLVVRAGTSVRAAALAIAVVCAYGWSLLSMLATLAQVTLLSFRLQPTIAVLLTAAGVFGFVEAAFALARRYHPHVNRRVLVAAAAVALGGAMAFSQDIPDVLRPDIVVAYTDTDGAGQRADRRPPGAERHYAEIDAAIQQATGRPRDETVVLTADYSFLSFYPYFGFQGLTSHYANPLALFDQRAAEIESWEDLRTADQFVAALDALPWRPPTVFLMRRGAGDTYTLRLASDVYPNQPNVKRYTVELDDALFDDPRFTVRAIGPFVLAIRTAG